MTIGERIKERRLIKGLSQTALANKAGISKQTLFKYENDVITNIPPATVEKLAGILCTTPSYIMGWECYADLFGVDQLSEVEKEKVKEYIEFLKFLRNS